MATIRAAHTTEQGQTFVVVWTDLHVLQSSQQSSDALRATHILFPRIPAALMALDSRGTPQYRGSDRNLINFLASVPYELLPWKDYNVG